MAAINSSVISCVMLVIWPSNHHSPTEARRKWKYIGLSVRSFIQLHGHHHNVHVNSHFPRKPRQVRSASLSFFTCSRTETLGTSGTSFVKGDVLLHAMKTNSTTAWKDTQSTDSQPAEITHWCYPPPNSWGNGVYAGGPTPVPLQLNLAR